MKDVPEKMKALCFGIVLLLAFGFAERVGAVAMARKPMGIVEAAAPGQFFLKIADFQELPPGTTIRTGPHSSVIVVLAPDSGVRIEEETMIKLDELDFGKRGENGFRERLVAPRTYRFDDERFKVHPRSIFPPWSPVS